MSAVPTFAGRTSQHSGSRINQKTSSKIGDKKPSPQRNISKKSHNKICFCISCGCHVQDLKERCKNLTCALSCLNAEPLNQQTSCVEREKGYFPACKGCGSHDVQIKFYLGGTKISCYNCNTITNSLPKLLPSLSSYNFYVLNNLKDTVCVESSTNLVEGSSIGSFEDFGVITNPNYVEHCNFFEGINWKKLFPGDCESSDADSSI